MRFFTAFWLAAAAALLAQTGWAADTGSRKPAVKQAKKSKVYAGRASAAYARHGLRPAAFSPEGPHLYSQAAMVVDQEMGSVVYSKNADAITPIASITKLMTAMVVLDAGLPLDELVMITDEDLDTLKGTGSRLRVGTLLPRRELLRLALMSSENRAASALGRSYPGGLPAFVEAMNLKALELNMTKTRFMDSTGLNAGNVSTASDLINMVRGAYQYPLIRDFTTTTQYEVDVPGRRNAMPFHNSNALVASADWEIGLSKTGFIQEAGRCLVMQATIAGRPVILVLLDANGKMTRIADANRIKRWMEYATARRQIS